MHGIEQKFPFELSGGEQQRVAIARALLNTPAIIIADEPTGNLAPQTSLEIMEVFQKLHQQGMTVLMATHDYNMIVKFPGKILRCDEGTVYEVVQKKGEINFNQQKIAFYTDTSLLKTEGFHKIPYAYQSKHQKTPVILCTINDVAFELTLDTGYHDMLSLNSTELYSNLGSSIVKKRKKGTNYCWR